MITGGVLRVVGNAMGNRDLGAALPHPPWLLEPSRRNPRPRFALELECSRAYLRELNALRGSGEMRLSASVSGWVLLTTAEPIPEDPTDAFMLMPPQESAPAGAEDDAPRPITKRLYSFQAATADLPVNTQKWLEILGQCGFMRTMMFEVPLPERGDASGLGEVAAALERAVALHRQGDFLSKEAIASLRDVIDALLKWDRTLRRTDKQAKEYAADYRGTSKQTRLRHLLWSLQRLVDLAHHRPRKGMPVWTRHDAEWAITSLALLVRRLVEDLPLKNLVP
jgi:hypothetical protein